MSLGGLLLKRDSVDVNARVASVSSKLDVSGPRMRHMWPPRWSGTRARRATAGECSSNCRRICW